MNYKVSDSLHFQFEYLSYIDDYWDQWPLVNNDMIDEEHLKLYSIPDIDIPPSPPPAHRSSSTQSSASTGNNILDILTLPSSNRIKPSQRKPRKKKKKPVSEYRPPSPFSPKPDYKSMDIEQIKKHAMKYGLSTAQSKGRLVKILDEIYNVTHQYETDTDYELEPDPRKPSFEMKDLSHTPPTPAIIPESKKARKRPAIHQMSSSDETEENRPPPMKKAASSATSEDDDADHQGRFLELTVHELSSNTSSSSLSIHGTPPPISDSPKKPKTKPKGPKKPKLETPTIPLKELVRNYIESKPQIHARILCYEPIDFEEFHKQMKTDLNMKIVSKELMQCLDDQCITFTLRSRKGAFTSVMRAKRRHK